ncbi:MULTISPECIES: hypothetical protein [Thermococcus]|uniref:Uncharacterized protein n=1 Tax=Thermococcus paralvinellae TaxID=582419 RepID=W0I4J1_9EURY|nr:MULTISPECIES: hypothetical protein [Thermococcus]AHF80959.1 Hypothetical protein TES1_1583 [Thermococcus paralvinellae]NJE04109.1 hypothetical protein [Thermococcus sp. MV11]
MEKRMVSLTFLILLLFVSFVLAGDPQTSPQQTSQTSNNELAECEANLSLLQQQLQGLNQTLENVTRERDYYKTLYENVTVNVTNLELIQIKQNITILNQQIQQLNMSLVNIERKIYDIKVWSVELAFGSIVGVTLLNSLVYYAFEKRRDKPPQEKEEKEKGEERKNGFKGARHPESHS